MLIRVYSNYQDQKPDKKTFDLRDEKIWLKTKENILKPTSYI